MRKVQALAAAAALMFIGTPPAQNEQGSRSNKIQQLRCMGLTDIWFSFRV